MSEQEIDKQGCFGGALMGIAVLGLLLGIFSGHESVAYLGILIPVGYLINTN
jgi:hypothetical protein